MRNLISSEHPNVINYAASNKIRQLDLNTNTDQLIASLSWVPRCTASGHGYICAAGEDHGKIAIIKLDQTASEPTEVDSQLSIHGILHSQHRASRASRTRHTPSVKIDHVGTAIINSIGIYKVEGDTKFGIRDDIIALCTNNDASVRVLSLTEGLETAVLDLPFAVNHATISPDGETIVVVGDHQQAFFFEKIFQDPKESGVPKSRHASSHCKWVLLNIARLHCSESAGISGYFSTSWSSSNSLCAVASENGYITVFDVKRIRAEECGEDAVITIVSSTRPHPEPGPGSVRTLNFSPPPWEVLIWSEGRGRVCVADMRYGLNTRQVLHLDHNAYRGPGSTIDVETIKDHESAIPPNSSSMSSRTMQALNQARRVGQDYPVGEPESSMDEQQTWRSRQHLGHYNRNGEPEHVEMSLYRLPSLDRGSQHPDSRLIMDVLQSSGQLQTTPRSIRYRQAEISALREGAEGSSRLREGSDFMSDAMNVLRRHRGELGRHSTSSLPRRQTSYGMTATDGMHAPNDPQSWADLSADFIPSNDLRSRVRNHLVDEPQSYHTYSNIGEPSRPSRHQVDQENEFRIEDSRLSRAEARARRLKTQYQLTPCERDMLASTASRSREDGPRTAGLLSAGIVVSHDGQSIWAGCEDGIYEFKLNMRDVMSYPSLEAR